MEGFIQFICDRRSYQLTGKTDDAAMKRARINNVYRQDDRFSLWEAEQLGRAWSFEAISLHVKRVLLGRFFISKPAVEKLVQVHECDRIGVITALHHADLLFNPCIKMDVEDHVAVAVQHCIEVEACHRDVATILYRGATAEQVWSELRLKLSAPNRITALNEFRLYEMMTSLSYMDIATFDESDFYHVGPGAVDILTQLDLFPRSLDSARYLAEHVAQLLQFASGCFRVRCDKFAVGGFRFRCNKFTFRQVEDCACEYRKYLRSVEMGDSLPDRYRYVSKGRPHTC